MTIRHRKDCPGGQITTSPGKRGDIRHACTGCRRFAFLPKARPVAIPVPVGLRRWLGCIGCGTDIWTTDRRPRVPLCPTCKGERIQQANHDRRARREANA